MNTRNDTRPACPPTFAGWAIGAGAGVAGLMLLVPWVLDVLSPLKAAAAVTFGGLAGCAVWLLLRLGEVHRQSDAALQRSKERLDLALSAAHIGTWDWNMETDVSSSDEHLPKIFGLTSETYAGGLKNFQQIVHPDDWERLTETLARCQQLDDEMDTEFRVVWPDGGIHFVRSQGRVYPDHAGRPLRMVGVCQDITQRRQTEAALRHSEERLGLAVKSAGIGTWVWRMSSNVISWDQAMHRLFGLAPGTFGGRYEDFAALLHPDDRKRVSAEVKRSVHENVEFDSEYRIIWPDGARRIIAARGKVDRDEAGNPTSMMGACLDVTARMNAEQALQETAAALERSNKELEIFAYVASHDLQEPVRAVSGCVDLLQRRCQGQLDEGARELMKHIVEGAARMRTLINDLLTYSRVNTKGRPFEPVNCEAVFQIILENLAVAVTESAALVMHDPLPEITADPTQVAQLFQNLIGNAIKYRDDVAPVIHVGAARETDGWLFSVDDNGIGIEPQYFERIFVLFQRLHSRGQYSGTGIGLALCKKIVERHGGRIWVESAAGKGSTFYFTIPDAKGSAVP